MNRLSGKRDGRKEKEIIKKKKARATVERKRVKKGRKAILTLERARVDLQA